MKKWPTLTRTHHYWDWQSKNKTQICLKTLISLSILYLLESFFYDLDIKNNSLEHLSPGLMWFESFKKNLLRFFSFYFTWTTFYQRFLYTFFIYWSHPITVENFNKHVKQFLKYTLTVFWSQTGLKLVNLYHKVLPIAGLQTFKHNLQNNLIVKKYLKLTKAINLKKESN